MTNKPDTMVIHAGQSPEPVTGAIMPPVFQTSTYAQEWPAKHTGYEYGRSQNPTREALERCVAALEYSTDGVAFASGLAATTAIIQTLPANTHVVCGDDVYGGTYRLFETIFRKAGLTFSYVDFSSCDLSEAIGENTGLVWLESPTNPLLKIADIQKICERAHAVGAIVAVDNTFATPIFQTPIRLGADLVVHSTTKYLNGHSDVVGGIVCTANAELAEILRYTQNAAGAIPGPWDCWLTLRGIKTLSVRMARHDANARAIVHWLQQRSDVRKIYYPGLASHVGHEIAAKQMSGFGGMISFVLDADIHTTEKFCASTKIFACAESLGGVESLLEIPATMTHASIPLDQRIERGIEDGLVRLSVGIEHVEDLIADLDQAIRTARA